MPTTTTPVPIGQDEAEFAQLLDLYKERQPRRVLEVGTWHGGTLYHWLVNAAPNAVVVAVDDRHFNAPIYPTWVPPGVELVTIRGNSTDPDVILNVWRHGPYDFTFIDADHHDEMVRADWKNY